MSGVEWSPFHTAHRPFVNRVPFMTVWR